MSQRGDTRAARARVSRRHDGRRAHGLPLGVQLVGPFDGDSALLGWAQWAAGVLAT